MSQVFETQILWNYLYLNIFPIALVGEERVNNTKNLSFLYYINLFDTPHKWV